MNEWSSVAPAPAPLVYAPPPPPPPMPVAFAAPVPVAPPPPVSGLLLFYYYYYWVEFWRNFRELRSILIIRNPKFVYPSPAAVIRGQTHYTFTDFPNERENAREPRSKSNICTLLYLCARARAENIMLYFSFPSNNRERPRYFGTIWPTSRLDSNSLSLNTNDPRPSSHPHHPSSLPLQLPVYE